MMKDKRSAKDPITTYTVQGFLVFLVNYNLRFMIKHCQAACSVTDEFEFLDPDIRMPGMVLGTENFDKFHVAVNAIDAMQFMTNCNTRLCTTGIRLQNTYHDSKVN